MANHLTDKVSYIRGLMEGMKFDTTSDEGMLLNKIVELLGDMAEEIGAVSEAQDELSEYVDSIDEDLNELEEVLCSEEEEEEAEDDDDGEDGDEDDFACDGFCESCDGCDGDDEDGEDDDNIFVECICPNCKASFYVKENELSADSLHICPRCEARVHVVPDYEDDEEIPVAHLADDADKDE